MTKTDRNHLLRGAVVLLGLSFVLGCRQDMHDAPKLEPLEASDLFVDGRGSRLLLEGTVARGDLRADVALYTGRGEAGELIDELPVPLDGKLLERGRQRFDVFCSPCHGRTATGNGMVVQRGFKAPQTFHSDRMRGMPIGYYFDVMTRGFGAMSSYAAQVPVADRWAIAAYIRTLQLSQHVAVEGMTPELRAALEEHLAGKAAEPAEESHAP